MADQSPKTAVITIAEMLQPTKPKFAPDGQPANAKFKCTAGKTWNYAFNGAGQNIAPHFAEGKRIKIVYVELPNERSPEYPMKFINAAVKTEEPNTWPDKEAFKGNESKKRVDDNGKPLQRSREEMLRTSALECACRLLAGTPGIGYTDVLDQANVFLTYLDPPVVPATPMEAAEMAMAALGGSIVDDDDDDIPF